MTEANVACFPNACRGKQKQSRSPTILGVFVNLDAIRSAETFTRPSPNPISSCVATEPMLVAFQTRPVTLTP